MLAEGFWLRDLLTNFWLPPLWGTRLKLARLPDGSATTLDGAVRAHGGEGNASRERYLRLSESERAALLRFVGSL